MYLHETIKKYQKAKIQLLGEKTVYIGLSVYVIQYKFYRNLSNSDERGTERWQ